MQGAVWKKALEISVYKDMRGYKKGKFISRQCARLIKKADKIRGLRTLKQYGTTRVRQNKLS